MFYVKYYNTLCNNFVIDRFSSFWDAKYVKDRNFGEWVDEKGNHIDY